MAADEDAPATLDIDLLAASLRADAGDVGAFVEALAAKLEAAVPAGVSVERPRGRLFGARRVQRIVLDAGERRLELRAVEGSVETYCSRLSGGIVLKREQMDTDAWMRALGEALAVQAEHSATTRQALERLLNE
ncbi:MAG: hypothetical protein ACRDNJ_11520 [Solirubrobacteraceae bacterium]